MDGVRWKCDRIYLIVKSCNPKLRMPRGELAAVGEKGMNWRDAKRRVWLISHRCFPVLSMIQNS
jgi:hypothetical protein